MLALQTACLHPTTNKPYVKAIIGGKENSSEGRQVCEIFFFLLIFFHSGSSSPPSPPHPFTLPKKKGGEGEPIFFFFFFFFELGDLMCLYVVCVGEVIRMV